MTGPDYQVAHACFSRTRSFARKSMRHAISAMLLFSLAYAIAIAAEGSPSPGNDHERDERGNAHQVRFSLRKGRGTPVCEAYLQRLNESTYTKLPYCGLPDDTRVPSFPRLNRVWMTWPEIEKIKGNLDDFVGKGVLSPGKPRSYENTGYQPSTYRFDPKIDIDNDGTPDDVIMWDSESRDHPQCGQYYGQASDLDKGSAIGVILKSDGLNIDEKKTREVFGNKVGGYIVPTGPDEIPVLYARYAPVGLGYNVFEYQRLFYYSTYLDDTNMSPSERRRVVDVLGVFLRKNSVTEEICEYHSVISN